MHLTLYRGARQPVPLRQDDFDSWAEVVEALEDIVQREAPKPTASDLAYAHGDAREAQKLGLLAFAPHRLRTPYRKLENVIEVTLMVIDVDRCNADALAERITELGIAAYMYASPSDNPLDRDPDARRVRVVAPVSRSIAVDECRATRLAFAEALGLAPGCGVEGAIDAAKLFFCGRFNGAPPRQTWIFPGAKA